MADLIAATSALPCTLTSFEPGSAVTDVPALFVPTHVAGFVERDTGVFEKREVTLASQTRNHAYVWTGLKAGEKVVSVGALLLSAELASSSR